MHHHDAEAGVLFPFSKKKPKFKLYFYWFVQNKETRILKEAMARPSSCYGK
jgi:hypothetical protein